MASRSPPFCSSPRFKSLDHILAVSRAYRGHTLSMTKTKPNTFSPYLALLPGFLTLRHPTILPLNLAPNHRIPINCPLVLTYLSIPINSPVLLMLRPNGSISKLRLIQPSSSNTTPTATAFPQVFNAHPPD